MIRHACLARGTSHCLDPWCPQPQLSYQPGIAPLLKPLCHRGEHKPRLSAVTRDLQGGPLPWPRDDVV